MQTISWKSETSLAVPPHHPEQTVDKTNLWQICKMRCSTSGSEQPLQMAPSFLMLANNCWHASWEPAAFYTQHVECWYDISNSNSNQKTIRDFLL